MRRLIALLAACANPYPTYDPPRPPRPWPVPASWRHERLELPLEFAPSIDHRGVEELRFAPKFFEPSAPGYWAYAFVWRLEGYPPWNADVVGAELATYFQGLTKAVDDKLDTGAIVVRATPDGARLAIAAHVIDAFTSKQPLDLAGTGKQIACPAGAVWIFTFAPVHSPMRAEVEALAAQATCGQPPL